MLEKSRDGKNLRCLMPIVMLSREMDAMATGETCEMIASGPAWCRRTIDKQLSLSSKRIPS